MELQIPPKFESVFRVSCILMLMSTFTIFFMGYANSQLHEENKGIEAFLLGADNLQVNFEKSLSMYTESTQGSIDYLASLRPDNENGYIQFISMVESLGQNLGISLRLKTLDGDDLGKDETGSRYIDYQIDFYGREDQVRQVLSGLESLNYFTRVMDIHYETFEFFDAHRNADTPNVTIILRLYVK